jgi:hypothetical protein
LQSRASLLESNNVNAQESDGGMPVREESKAVAPVLKREWRDLEGDSEQVFTTPMKGGTDNASQKTMPTAIKRSRSESTSPALSKTIQRTISAGTPGPPLQSPDTDGCSKIEVARGGHSLTPETSVRVKLLFPPCADDISVCSPDSFTSSYRYCSATPHFLKVTT